MKFQKVNYVDIGDIIARVNDETGELQLNKKIFDYLPAGFREFVLLHEDGHLTLKTHDELAANLYAISNYIPVDVTTDELGRRIVVMTEALTPGADKPYWKGAKKDTEGFANFGIGDIAGALNGITSTLPSLGIGSKARINETNATAAAQMALAQQSAKSSSNLILIATGAIVVIIIIYFTVKSFSK